MNAITLTTDFGTGSPYVAAMKGVILSINPAATIVDITHDVPPQDVRYAAIVLEDVAERFPEGTIHVAVVDPGVGTDRGIVYARIGRQQFVAPDNGLLSRLAHRSAPESVLRLSRPEYWLQPVSATFHGRDVMAPVAARLSLGLAPKHLGLPQSGLVMLRWPTVRVDEGGIHGSILAADSFGNLVTDITAGMLAKYPREKLRVRCLQQTIEGLSTTYGNHSPSTLAALIGSSDRLEIAVVGGSAAKALGAKPGDDVLVELP